jgi:hypothetical protein
MKAQKCHGAECDERTELVLKWRIRSKISIYPSIAGVMSFSSVFVEKDAPAHDRRVR